MEGASGSKKPSSLTRGRWERSSVQRAKPASCELRSMHDGSVGGLRPASFVVDNAAARWRFVKERPPRHPRRMTGQGHDGPKLERRRHAFLHSGLHRRKAVRRRRERTSGSTPGGPPRRESWGSGTQRSAGARVGSRLQKSVRGIFLLRSRGAERQTERGAGSATRRHACDEATPTVPGERVLGEARKLNRERTKSASIEAPKGEASEDRIDGRRPGPRGRRALTGAAAGGGASKDEPQPSDRSWQQREAHVRRKPGAERRTRALELSR
jgi:hypothetical protein